jgi:hypothetical protein
MGQGARRSIVATLFVLALVLSCAASAAEATNRPKSGTPAAQYLAATKKTSTDQSRFYASMTTTPVLPVVTKRATALASSYMKFAQTLTHVEWKGKAKRDAHNFEAYLRTFAQFLLTIKEQTSSTMPSWSVQLTAIGNAGHKPFDALSHALGLTVNAVTPKRGTPAPPTTTTTVPVTTTTTSTVPPTTTTTTTPPPPPPTTSPPPSTTAPAPAGCTPKTDAGGCYEPGEYCRDDDHGVSGVAGDGEAITCEDNNGWRWEPT